MRLISRKLSTRLFVSLVTFTAGVAVTLLWVVPRFQSVHSPSALKGYDTLKDEEVSVPDGWKKLEIKNKVAMRLPQDMKPTKLIGDSFNYREAYNNQDTHLTIVYGEPTPCDTPRFLLERPSYSESVIDIDGRKAKLSIDGFYRPKFIIARLCFLDTDDHAMQLGAVAYCKDDRALETAQKIFTSIKFKANK